MTRPEVSIHLIVYNGEQYIGKCLEHVRVQTYENVIFRVFNNASVDATIEIARNMWPAVEVVNFPQNYFTGGGFNRSLSYSESPYVVQLSVDVMLAPDFIERAVAALEAHPEAAVLQPKVLRYELATDTKTKVIDTAGMDIFKSRRVINRGHGEEDIGQYDRAEEIFCYEGAVPVFCRAALEEARMEKRVRDRKFPYEYLDEDFVWYADEVDLGWRLRLLGWSMWYAPAAVAWHDRQTTHALSAGRRGFIEQRKTVPAFKRMLDLRNQRLTFIKNDFFVNILLCLPWIIMREAQLLAYVILWERSSLRGYVGIVHMVPLMMRKRRRIMKQCRVSARDMRQWFRS
ncbi:MAG: glycosyltransferase family 2 protein [Candidatus Spechtbacterales bacterium]